MNARDFVVKNLKVNGYIFLGCIAFYLVVTLLPAVWLGASDKSWQGTPLEQTAMWVRLISTVIVRYAIFGLWWAHLTFVGAVGVYLWMHDNDRPAWVGSVLTIGILNLIPALFSIARLVVFIRSVGSNSRVAVALQFFGIFDLP